jgi:hypothetical protein
MPSRRELLALAIVAWSHAVQAAQRHAQALPTLAKPGDYAFRLFDQTELATLRRLAAILIPADDTILALALRASERMADRMKKGEL